MKTKHLETQNTRISSTDGKRLIPVETFDQLADSGSVEIDAFLDWTQAKRGGSRPGSGRKRKLSVRLEVQIRPDLREKLRLKAKQKGVSQVQLIESVLEKL